VNSSDLKKAKRDVRRRVLALREELPPEERARLATRAAARFLALPQVGSAGTVMAFWAFGSEMPTMPLIEALIARGATVALPRIVDGELQARTWRPGEPMAATAFGAMEPEAGMVLAAHEIDVIATPAVAFDRDGRRVGYGGGFYDRFVPRARRDALRVGIGFGMQVVEGELPAGAFDLRVEFLVTESETVRCRIDP